MGNYLPGEELKTEYAEYAASLAAADVGVRELGQSWSGSLLVVMPSSMR